jgi:hypothetical protein
LYPVTHAKAVWFNQAASKTMNDFIDDNIDPIEGTSTASQSYTVGEHLIYGGIRYIVSSAITAGDTLTPGTNIDAMAIGDEIEQINTDLTVIKTITGSCTKTQLKNGYTVAYPTGMDSSKMMVIGADVSPSTARWDALSNSFSSSYQNHGWILDSSGILILSSEYGTGSDSMDYRIAYIEL